MGEAGEGKREGGREGGSEGEGEGEEGKVPYKEVHVRWYVQGSTGEGRK